MQSLRLFTLVICFLCLPFSQAVAAETEHDHATDTIWTCSMHPQIQLPEAGQCPICFMDLIEVQKESSDNRQSLRQISFDRRARKLAEVEVQAVIRGHAKSEISMVGKIDYDETRVGTITSRVNGRIDKLFVDYTGSHVSRGQAMVNIYSPELITAQAELIQGMAASKRSENSTNDIIKRTAARTLAASREKLRLLGLDDKQLRSIEQLGKPTEHITLTAPLSGIVIKKDVTEGMYVKTGSPIYTLADLDRLWVILEAYESDIQAIFIGQQVDFTVESYPGTSFQGEVEYIDPLVNEKSRTVRVRLGVENKGAKLKPGMFVRAVSSSAAQITAPHSPLLIPVSAPLLTGKRALIYVQVPDQPGTYIGKEIVLGQRQGGYYQVKSGLQEGELVVTRGNFKIDSAIQLQARPSMMTPYVVHDSNSEVIYPTLFTSKLKLLNNSFGDLSREVHEGKRDAIQVTLDAFTRSLVAISGDALEEDAKLSWQEISMLLRSDTILLAEADATKEIERIYARFAEHFHLLRNRFSLPDMAAGSLGSAQLREKTGDFVNVYLQLEQHLAEDATDAAKVDITALIPLSTELLTALEKVDDQLATTLATAIKKDMHNITQATDISAIRVAFYPLSQSLVQLVENFGSSGDAPLYVQFCPMAFENKGATWLATTEEINNPYFGAMMLRCGEVRKQVKR